MTPRQDVHRSLQNAHSAHGPYPDAVAMSFTDLHHETRPRHALPAGLRLGAVELTVSDLDRSIAWYEQALGLRVHRRDKTVASLGDGQETLVVVHEDPLARPAGRGTTGLYHYALLYPTREELARAGTRLVAHSVQVDGATDHGTHEAIYLPDPDGNGIELAWDRAPEDWPAEEDMAAAQRALDFPSVMATVAGEPIAPSVATGVRMGHVHLYVGDVADAVSFYRDAVGFELRADFGVAAFLRVDDYHHHVAVNVWNGRGATAPEPHTAGLRRWTVELPSTEDVDALRRRLVSVDAEIHDIDGGIVTADPFGTAAAFVVAEGAR
jgi:catechol 2,3-dioxygenase